MDSLTGRLVRALDDALGIIETTDDANSPGHDWYQFMFEARDLIAEARGEQTETERYFEQMGWNSQEEKERNRNE